MLRVQTRSTQRDGHAACVRQRSMPADGAKVALATHDVGPRCGGASRHAPSGSACVKKGVVRMYVKRLRLTAAGQDNREGFATIGERLFPGVSNPTGHLLDLLKRGR